MIKKLKKRFITIYMVILSCFLVTVLLGIYVIVYHSEVTQSEQIMQMAMQNNSRLEEGTPPTSGSLPKKVINFSEGSSSVPTSYDEYVQEDDYQENEEVSEDYSPYDQDVMFFNFNNFCVQQSDFWETFKSDSQQNEDYWDDYYWYPDDFGYSYQDDWQYQQDDWDWQWQEEQERQRQDEEERQRQQQEEERRKSTTTATTKATEATTQATTKATTSTTKTTTATTKATTSTTKTTTATTKATTSTTKTTTANTKATTKATTKSTTSTTKTTTNRSNAEPLAVGNTTVATTAKDTTTQTKASNLPLAVDSTLETSTGDDATEDTAVTSTPDETPLSDDTTSTTTLTTTNDTSETTVSNLQQRTKPEVSSSENVGSARKVPSNGNPPQDVTAYEGNLARNTIYVKANHDGEIQRISYQYFESSDNLSLEQTVGKILESGETLGKVTIDNVKFRYYVFQPDDGDDYDIVFLDRAIELSTLRRLVHIFIVIGLLGFIALFGVSWLLASWAITPIADAWDKQRQFIADASHELKTPLTIIATNTDVVLSNYNDTVKNQSKWLTYIKSETVRMSKLVSDLLYIAKSDVNEVVMVMTEFNLSHTVQGVCLVFESVAFEKGKFLDSDIDEDINFKGDEDRIKQLITILIDNAIVHSEGNANIMVRLKPDIKNRVRLSVTNTHGEDIPKGTEERLFERFFRVDKARNRSNGSHGLGLNIAQSIVKNHNGEITVTSTEDHVVTFTVLL